MRVKPPTPRSKWNEMEQNGTELKVCRSYALLRAVPRRGWLPRLRVAAVPSVVPAKAVRPLLPMRGEGWDEGAPVPAQTTRNGTKWNVKWNSN